MRIEIAHMKHLGQCLGSHWALGYPELFLLTAGPCCKPPPMGSGLHGGVQVVLQVQGHWNNWPVREKQTPGFLPHTVHGNKIPTELRALM